MFFGRRGAHERRRALALRWPWIYAPGFEGRPTPHPHLAVRNAALGGAAFSVAGLAVEASRASRDGRDRLEWALTRRTAVTGWLPRSASRVAQGTSPTPPDSTPSTPERSCARTCPWRATVPSRRIPWLRMRAIAHQRARHLPCEVHGSPGGSAPRTAFPVRSLVGQLAQPFLSVHFPADCH